MMQAQVWSITHFHYLLPAARLGLVAVPHWSRSPSSAPRQPEYANGSHLEYCSIQASFAIDLRNRRRLMEDVDACAAKLIIDTRRVVVQLGVNAG